MTSDALQGWMRGHRLRVEEELDSYLPGENVHPARLHQAMRYAVLNGGKRLRAMLVYAAGEACGAPMTRLNTPACAVELLHAYSLVHDDLPAMDDDDLRRGKPSCHRAFDEATAILAGDALQTLAFNVLTDEVGGSATQRLRMLRSLADASGSRGMAGGQCIDLEAVGKELALEELEIMHAHKTGALIRSAVQMGALCSNDVNDQILADLDKYASRIGLAFQIQDDVLDIEGDTETLGKPQGADVAMGKPTYPAFLGLERAKAAAVALHEEA
ncbi:MAG: (2E,6E)-farnesyl diphosphate synthase, partial [Gammaproteobacteria bacterium]|nr:(2E,6E)-farnesyl diphosphate synthase [Gammaproteobacteria bacterium]